MKNAMKTPLELTLEEMGPRPAPNGGKNQKKRDAWRSAYYANRRFCKRMGWPTA